MLVKLHKAQLEAMHSSKHSDSEREFEQKKEVLSNQNQALNGFAELPSNDFGRLVAAMHARTVKKQEEARAVT